MHVAGVPAAPQRDQRRAPGRVVGRAAPFGRHSVARKPRRRKGHRLLATIGSNDIARPKSAPPMPAGRSVVRRTPAFREALCHRSDPPAPIAASERLRDTPPRQRTPAADGGPSKRDPEEEARTNGFSTRSTQCSPPKIHPCARGPRTRGVENAGFRGLRAGSGAR